MAQTTATFAIAAVSSLLKVGVISLLVILVTGLPIGQRVLGGLAISSITFQLLSILPIIYLSTGSRSCSSGIGEPSIQVSTKWKGLIPSTVLPCFAEVFIIATLILTKATLSGSSHLILQRRPSMILLGLFIVWIASLIVEGVFYLLICKRSSPVIDREVSTTYYPSATTASDMIDANELNVVSVNHPHQSISRSLSSPPPTPRTMHGDASLRSSLTLAVRPATSKTKLLPYPRAYLRNSTATTSTTSNAHSSRQSQDSGLDTWDTSSVTPSIRETVLRSSPSFNNPATLSPIPGSRSPSPANLLQDFPLPPSSASTSIPASPALSPQQNFSRPCIRQRSTSVESLCLADRSSAIAEEHIHPLFRTSSPSPAPAATPGTNVTAAPGSFDGLHINEHSLHKIRSERSLNGSRNFHPPSAGPSSPLVRSSPLSFPHEDIGIVDDEAGRRGKDT